MNNNIIIFLFFLFTPYLAFCQDGEVLYKWETSLGIERKSFGDEETQPFFKGEVENGLPEGLGILIKPNGEK